MTGPLLATRDALARLAEVTIGLGIEPTPGCSLCMRGEPICPIHYGQAIADALLASDVVRDPATLANDGALADAWDEGHRTPRLLDRDAPPCLCHAYSESECACGNYGATRPAPNPYRGC